jgi:hypothetical protein
MVDGINMLRNVGLEPTGLKVDARWLERLLPAEIRIEIFKADNNGVVDVERAMSKYRYELMGVPIEPDFGKNEIKAVKKVGVEL